LSQYLTWLRSQNLSIHSAKYRISCKWNKVQQINQFRIHKLEFFFNKIIRIYYLVFLKVLIFLAYPICHKLFDKSPTIIKTVFGLLFCSRHFYHCFSSIRFLSIQFVFDHAKPTLTTVYRTIWRNPNINQVNFYLSKKIFFLTLKL